MLFPSLSSLFHVFFFFSLPSFVPQEVPPVIYYSPSFYFLLFLCGILPSFVCYQVASSCPSYFVHDQLEIYQNRSCFIFLRYANFSTSCFSKNLNVAWCCMKQSVWLYAMNPKSFNNAKMSAIDDTFIWLCKEILYRFRLSVNVRGAFCVLFGQEARCLCCGCSHFSVSPFIEKNPKVSALHGYRIVDTKTKLQG